MGWVPLGRSLTLHRRHGARQGCVGSGHAGTEAKRTPEQPGPVMGSPELLPCRSCQNHEIIAPSGARGPAMPTDFTKKSSEEILREDALPRYTEETWCFGTDREFSASFDHQASATISFLFLGLSPPKANKTVSCLVSFHRGATQSRILFLVSSARATARRIYHCRPWLSDASHLRRAPSRFLARAGRGARRVCRTEASCDDAGLTDAAADLLLEPTGARRNPSVLQGRSRPARRGPWTSTR
jgi:hypothetical protein